MSIFRAFKTGLDRLTAHYRRLDDILGCPSDPDSRAEHVHLPYPLRPSLFSPVSGSEPASPNGSFFGLMPGTAVPFASSVSPELVDRLGLRDKLLYLARLPPTLAADPGAVGGWALVKFVPPGRPFTTFPGRGCPDALGRPRPRAQAH